MNISNRIKELRYSVGLTAKELAQKTGIPYDSIKNYEYGRRDPTGKALVALEQFFNVSGAYLLGESNEKDNSYCWEDTEIVETVKNIFANLLSTLMESMLNCNEQNQKMLFNILVELRHVISSNYFSEQQKTSSLDLIQSAFSLSTQFIDACSLNDNTDSSLDRITKVKQSCVNNYQLALENKQKYIEI